MLFDYHFRNYNLRLLLYTTFLSIIGIMAIRSASIQDPSVAIKQSIGKLDIDASIPEIVDACSALKIDRLPLQPEHIERIKSLPLIHRDPFDRLIISQAIMENLTIITMDQTIPQYEVKTLW
jgi:PIN domain nuclease of toxin-antitoxin system